MKATRHNGRAGKHGAYNPKHNDREFDEENSEHIDAERTKFNVYWDCYQGYSLPNAENERAKFTFTEVEKAYYVEHFSEHVDGQNERNRKARHYDSLATLTEQFPLMCLLRLAQNTLRNLISDMVLMFIYWTGLCILMKLLRISMKDTFLTH